MNQDELERSFRDRGFLSPVVTDFITTHRASHAVWFTLAEDLNEVGQRQLQRGADTAVKVSSMDPVNIGVRLLIRTMSNFQGCCILIERGMAVEAQTLVRICYENGFWLAALVSNPEDAIRALKLDETKSQDSRAAAYLRMANKHGNSTMQAKASHTFANRRARQKGQALSPQGVAKLADWEPNYVFYKEISANSAHPSLNSLDRYLNRDADGNWRGGFILGFETDHIGTTLNLGSFALISALAAFGQLMGPSDDDQVLFDLNERYATLAGIGGR